jgi:hypothetical protein
MADEIFNDGAPQNVMPGTPARRAGGGLPIASTI